MQQSLREKPVWAKQFKIDDDSWKSLCEQAQQKNVTPLAVALESGLLNENKLLSWDREQSGVASLKAIFFNASAPQELFSQYNFEQCRAAGCMPVATWQDHVFFAKLSSEPTGLESANPQAIWVLAPWTGMKKWFETWEKSANVSQENKSEVSFDAPAGLSLGDEIKLPDLPPVPSAAEPAKIVDAPAGMKISLEPSNEDLAAPVGINAEAASEVNIDFSAIGVADDHGPAVSEKSPEPKAEHKAAVQQVEHKVQKTEPEDGMLAVDLDLGLPEIPTEAAKADSAKPAVNTVATPTAVKPPPMPPLPEDVPGVKPNAPKMPVPPVPHTNSAIKATPPPVPKTTGMPAAGPGPGPAPAGAAMGQAVATISYDQLESRMKMASSQDTLASALIGAWQNQFEQVMILLVQQEQLIPWWFNNKWKTPIKRGEGIALDTPSIFKIVADTSKPYHGFVSQGQVNDYFFKRCNAGVYPEHVTIVPVMAGDKVVAMLMGLCAKEMGRQIALPTLEEHGRFFAASLVKFFSPAQKAG